MNHWCTAIYIYKIYNLTIKEHYYNINFTLTGRTRLKLSSPNPDGRTAGFVTLNCWTFDITKIAGSTDSTPLHSASYQEAQVQKVSNILGSTKIPLHSYLILILRVLLF